jgi:hypothetical protein
MHKPLNISSILPWEADLSIIKAEQDLLGVSIVIPIYNAGNFLEKTLRSLLCNDLNGCEIIVMDGGSNDNTSIILEHYKEMFDICISERDEGQSDAINKGFELTSKQILYWLNGDDIILPNTLTKMRKYFTENIGAEVVVGNAFMTEINFEPIRHFLYSKEKLAFTHLLDYASNHLIQPSVFFTKNAWNAVGPLKKELHYAMDADLFIGMSKHFMMHHFDCDIAYSVYHEECKTRGKRAESITELALVQAQHGGYQYAKKTLDILVDMYNQLDKTMQSSTGNHVLENKLNSLKAEYNKNIELALLADIDLI